MENTNASAGAGEPIRQDNGGAPSFMMGFPLLSAVLHFTAFILFLFIIAHLQAADFALLWENFFLADPSLLIGSASGLLLLLFRRFPDGMAVVLRRVLPTLVAAGILANLCGYPAALALWVLGVAALVLWLHWEVQVRLFHWFPLAWTVLLPWNYLVVLYLFLDRHYNQITRSHLSLPHLNLLWECLVGREWMAFSVLGVTGPVVAGLLFTLVGFGLATLAIGVFWRWPFPRAGGGRWVPALVVAALVASFVRFNGVVEADPFWKFLVWRGNMTLFRLPDPDRFKTPEMLAATGAPERLDLGKVSRQGTYGWTKPGPRLNVVVFLIESLRAEALARDMPQISALASQGYLLANHHSVSNDSMGSALGLLYGLFPLHFHRVYQSVFGLSHWLEFLRDSGYALLRIGDFGVTLTHPRYAYQPAETYARANGLPPPDDNDIQTITGLIPSLVLHELQKPGVHYVEGYLYATHANYYYPPAFEIFKPVAETGFDYTKTGYSDVVLTGLRNRYRNACRYVDTVVGEFFRRARALGLDRTTVFILTGDHGECLGENDFLFHVTGPHALQFRTPLIILAPGLSPTTVTAPTQHTDLIPTLAPILGYRVQGLHGRNALLATDGPVLSMDPSANNRLILRRDGVMSLFELSQGGRLDWVVTLNDDASIDDRLYRLYQPAGIPDLARRIERDRRDIIRLLEPTP